MKSTNFATRRKVRARRHRLIVRVARALDLIEQLEFDAQDAGRAGALSDFESNELAVALSHAWHMVAGARPKFAGAKQ